MIFGHLTVFDMYLDVKISRMKNILGVGHISHKIMNQLNLLTHFIESLGLRILIRLN